MTAHRSAPAAGVHIRLANPRGFCAGVDRAIEIVARALELFGGPVYVRHELVHNRFVVADMSRRGAVFVGEIDEIPHGAVTVFSAHGVSQQVREQARQRDLQVFDATCPLVTKVHMEIISHADRGRECVLIGHAGHPEVEGTLGQLNARRGHLVHLVETEEDAARLCVRQPQNLAYVTQTTLSVSDTARIVEVLQARFPDIIGPRKSDICYATQNRQQAVRQLAAQVDLVLVVGSANSSNSNRLRELAQHAGARAHLIDGADDLHPQWFAGVSCVGITAGASAPEVLVQEVVQRLQQWGAMADVQDMPGAQEGVSFPIPRQLRVREKPSS